MGTIATDQRSSRKRRVSAENDETQDARNEPDFVEPPNPDEKRQAKKVHFADSEVIVEHPSLQNVVEAVQNPGLSVVRQNQRIPPPLLLQGHQAEVTGLAFASRNDQRESYHNIVLASCSLDKSLVLWDFRDTCNNARQPYFRARAKIPQVAKNALTDLVWLSGHESAAGLIVSSCDGNIHQYDTDTCQKVRKASAHTKPINKIAFSGALNCLATASDDGAVKLWDLRAKTSVSNLNGAAPVLAVEFGTTNRQYLLFTSSLDGLVQMWDQRKLSVSCAQLDNDDHQLVSDLKVCHDGTMMFASSLSGNGLLYDVQAFVEQPSRLLHTFPSVSSNRAINASVPIRCSWSSDDQCVIQGSFSGAPVIWNVVQRNIQFCLSSHSCLTGLVAFHPEQDLAASGDVRGHIRTEWFHRA